MEATAFDMHSDELLEHLDWARAPVRDEGTADDLRTSSIVAAWNGDGYVRTQRTDAEGNDRIEHLTAGTWQVELVETEYGSSSSSSDSSHSSVPSDGLVRAVERWARPSSSADCASAARSSTAGRRARSRSSSRRAPTCSPRWTATVASS